MRKNILSQYNIISDLHTHTEASLHGYSTLKENIEGAMNNGIYTVATTDHFYDYSDKALLNNQVWRAVEAPFTTKGVRCISGGEISLEDNNAGFKYLKPIQDSRYKDICRVMIGSIHGIGDLTLVNFKEIIKLHKDIADYGVVNVFGHINRIPFYTLVTPDQCTAKELKKLFSEICKIAEDNNICIELNESSLGINNTYDPNNLINPIFLEEVSKSNCLVSLGSDAHFYEKVGRFDNCIKAANVYNIPKSRIVNTSLSLMTKAFGNIY